MVKETVIVGGSLLTLSLGLAWQKRFGGHPGHRLRLITVGSRLADYDLTTLINPPPSVEWHRLLPYAEIIVDRVRSVNLPDRRVVAEQGNYHFDEIIIDFTPYWSPVELAKISRHWRLLIAHLQANRRLYGKLVVQAPSVAGYQLALAALNDRRRLPGLSRQLKVATASGLDYLDRFIKQAGAVALIKTEKLPGLVINNPRPIVSRRRLRGVRLDHHLRVMVDGYLRPSGQNEVKIIDNPNLELLNSPRTARWLAERIIAGQSVQFTPSAILNDAGRRLDVRDEIQFEGWRSTVNYWLDRQVVNGWRKQSLAP